MGLVGTSPPRYQSKCSPIVQINNTQKVGTGGGGVPYIYIYIYICVCVCVSAFLGSTVYTFKAFPSRAQQRNASKSIEVCYSL